VDPWTDRLSEYLDDGLDANERERLERHLSECVECRASLADLRAVIARATALPPRVPARDLWPDIERRVRAVRPARRTFTFSLSQLAAAAIVLVALSGGLVWIVRAPATNTRETAILSPSGRRAPTTALPVSLADQTYDRAVADLQRALEADRARLDPNTVAIIQKNLAAIDAAIAQAQRALEADPANTYLNGHLADARRRKLALLQSVSAMTDPEG
jgi:anti-sigma factor RsiW